MSSDEPSAPASTQDQSTDEAMTSPGALALAATQGQAAPDLAWISGAAIPTGTRKFTLCWPSGDVIRNFPLEHDISVERFVQDMEEGLIAEIPRAKTREDGTWLESFHLLWNDIELREGQMFGDYGIPPDAVLTLVRTTISTSEAGEE